MDERKLFQQGNLIRVNKTDLQGVNLSAFLSEIISMLAELTDSITETDYRLWVQQSNEELIPKPLVLHFNFIPCISLDDYCLDLCREIELHGKLYDQDRMVTNFIWDDRCLDFVTPSLRQLLIEITRKHFLVSFEACEGSIDAINLDKQACDLIGIGISAISKVGGNLSQNTDNPEDYHSKLAGNRIPVIRGLVLLTSII